MSIPGFSAARSLGDLEAHYMSLSRSGLVVWTIVFQLHQGSTVGSRKGEKAGIGDAAGLGIFDGGDKGVAVHGLVQQLEISGGE